MGSTPNGAAISSNLNAVVQDETGARVTGVQWFEATDWQLLQDSLRDSADLPDEHSVWLTKAQSQVDDLTKKGFNVHKIRIEPASFTRWCSARGLRRNAGARALYVSTQLSFLTATDDD